jgi:hypothetical protein
LRAAAISATYISRRRHKAMVRSSGGAIGQGSGNPHFLHLGQEPLVAWIALESIQGVPLVHVTEARATEARSSQWLPPELLTPYSFALADQ